MIYIFLQACNDILDMKIFTNLQDFNKAPNRSQDLNLDYPIISLSITAFPLSLFSTMATLFARTDKKVGTLPTCSRRIFSPDNFNQSSSRIFVFALRRANKVAKWKI